MSQIFFTVTKIRRWFSDHWVHVTAVVMLCLFVLNGFWQKTVTDSLAEENQQEYIRHTQDLERLRVVHESEMAAQRAITERLQSDLTRIENDYTRRITDIETRQRTRRQTTVEETAGNPGEMARRLQERLGWRSE